MKCRGLNSAALKVHAHKSSLSSPDAVDFPEKVKLQCDTNYVSGEITENSDEQTKSGGISLYAKCVLITGKTVPVWEMSGSCVPLTCTDRPLLLKASLDSPSLNRSIG
eukprot:444377_1